MNIRSLASKAALISELTSDKNVDLFCQTETWLSEDHYISLNEATPPGQTNFNAPRCFGQEGGVAAIFGSSLSILTQPNTGNNSFESLVLNLSHPTWRTGQPAFFTVLSRPPGPYLELLSEFTEFLSSLVLKSDEVVNIDLNIDEANDSLAVASNSISS